MGFKVLKDLKDFKDVKGLKGKGIRRGRGGFVYITVNVSLSAYAILSSKHRQFQYFYVSLHRITTKRQQL